VAGERYGATDSTRAWHPAMADGREGTGIPDPDRQLAAPGRCL